jgi:hypothetical protein
MQLIERLIQDPCSSFSSWLTDKPSQESVGRPGVAKDCPGSRWLRHCSINNDGVFHCANGTFVKIGEDRFFLPELMEEFVKKTDQIREDITAQKALEILCGGCTQELNYERKRRSRSNDWIQ